MPSSVSVESVPGIDMVIIRVRRKHCESKVMVDRQTARMLLKQLAEEVLD